MRVLVFLSVIPRFFGRLAARLQQDAPEMKLFALANGRYHRRLALEGGAKWDHIALFSDVIRARGWDEPADVDFLSEMERLYGRPNLYLFTAADWEARFYPRAKMLRFLELAFRYMLEEWDRAHPDVVIAEGIDCGLTHILYSIAKARGVPYLFPLAGRFPGRTMFIGNPGDRCERAEELFAEFLRFGVPEEHRRDALQHIENLRQEGPKVTDLLKFEPQKAIRRNDLSYFSELYRIYREDTADYMARHPVHAIPQRLGRAVRARAAHRRFFQRPDPLDKYFVFPLHVQPEATTLTLAPFLIDEPALVANIAKSLPVGHWLYVKEHPYAIGRRSLREYEEMAALPNVKLIAPGENVRELVRRSVGVTTITGTMGLEALILRKPAITFARPFYVASGLTYEVNDIRDLPYQLQKAVDNHTHDEERLVTFVAAALAATYPIQVGYEKVSPASAMSDQNILKTARALSAEFQRRAATTARG